MHRRHRAPPPAPRIGVTSFVLVRRAARGSYAPWAAMSYRSKASRRGCTNAQSWRRPRQQLARMTAAAARAARPGKHSAGHAHGVPVLRSVKRKAAAINVARKSPKNGRRHQSAVAYGRVCRYKIG